MMLYVAEENGEVRETGLDIPVHGYPVGLCTMRVANDASKGVLTELWSHVPEEWPDNNVDELPFYLWYAGRGNGIIMYRNPNAALHVE